eukprot:8098239-Pyramimonas_sp.AAC.1
MDSELQGELDRAMSAEGDAKKECLSALMTSLQEYDQTAKEDCMTALLVSMDGDRKSKQECMGAL